MRKKNVVDRDAARKLRVFPVVVDVDVDRICLSEFSARRRVENIDEIWFEAFFMQGPGWY